jgi:transposase
MRKLCHLFGLCLSFGMRSAKSFRLSRKTAAVLNQWCRSTTLPHGQIMRAKIILQLSEGMIPPDVAAVQRTTAKIVHRWRNRFEAEGIDGLLERPRSGRPTVIDKQVIDKVIFLTMKCIPEEATHWSIELVARYTEVTRWQVRQIWKAADLRPHRLRIRSSPLWWTRCSKTDTPKRIAENSSEATCTG